VSEDFGARAGPRVTCTRLSTYPLGRRKELATPRFSISVTAEAGPFTNWLPLPRRARFTVWIARKQVLLHPGRRTRSASSRQESKSSTVRFRACRSPTRCFLSPPLSKLILLARLAGGYARSLTRPKAWRSEGHRRGGLQGWEIGPACSKFCRHGAKNGFSTREPECR
jgi:hypothetical protein